LLPKDLPAALAWLDDGEFDSLLAAVIDEAKRRNRAPESSIALHPPQKRTHSSEPALTRGQMNAVRAAFKAGVKPAMIARQFGISQSDVRKAIASEVRQAKL
jgi:predicted DNA binding protein